VLSEVVVVVAIVAFFTALAMVNLWGVVYRSSFNTQAHDLVKVFKMAATSAAETGRRYEVVLNFAEKNYILREITTALVAVEDILDEEIILVGEFNDDFQLSFVMFYDGEWTNEAPALIRVGKNGWQYGGKIVLLDGEGNEFSIVVNRLSRVVEFRAGDVPILMPKPADEMGF